MAEEEAKQNPSSLVDHENLLLMLQKLSCNNVNNNADFSSSSSSTNPIPSSSFGPQYVQPQHATGLYNVNNNNGTAAPTSLNPYSSSSYFGSEAYQDLQFQYVPSQPANGLYSSINSNGTIPYYTPPTNLLPSSFAPRVYKESQFQYVPEYVPTSRPVNLFHPMNAENLRVILPQFESLQESRTAMEVRVVYSSAISFEIARLHFSSIDLPSVSPCFEIQLSVQKPKHTPLF